jgi:cation/acetate symporter
VWSNVVRKGRDSEREEVHVARLAALGIGGIAIAIAIAGGSDLNVSYMVGLAFAVAASANFPALLLALTWRRFNTTGAVMGVLCGVISSVGLVLVGPDVRSDPLIELTQPAIISVPLGFLGCILGSLLSREEAKAESEFEELFVRSETGLGAEPGLGAELGAELPIATNGDGAAPLPRRERDREPAGVR